MYLTKAKFPLPKWKRSSRPSNPTNYLLDVYEVKHLKACATSAMRDARNGEEIIKKVKAETGIEIQIITGQEEASFIYENHIAENMTTEESYLYIDVAGQYRAHIFQRWQTGF